MKRESEKDGFFKRFFSSVFPQKGEKPIGVLSKIVLIISVISLIVSACFVAKYFLLGQTQQSVLKETREIWHNAEPEEEQTASNSSAVSAPKKKSTAKKSLTEKNPDFCGWISISNTRIDHPVYQTDNNKYYLDHNQNRKKSAYGAVYADYRCKLSAQEQSQNIVIYGHEMRNGSMFGTLKRLRKLNFYVKNPIVKFSTLYSKADYKIYAVFVLNADPKDDGNYIYNIYKNEFSDEEDFNTWTAEAYQRSLINTGVDVRSTDEILTLITCSTKDFKNARLVVMARKLRTGESPKVDASRASVNKNPRYPKAWYDKRGKTYPF